MWLSVCGILDKSAQQAADTTAVSTEERENTVLQKEKLTKNSNNQNSFKKIDFLLIRAFIF